MLNQNKRLHALIVEDEPVDVDIIVRSLRKLGYDIAWTQAETEADYRKALTAGPDIVLSDYRLPHFSGQRALAVLRESGLDVPFILISGGVSEEQAVEIMRQGADDFLIKDRLARLGSAIEAALEKRRLHQQAQQTEVKLGAFLDNTTSVTFLKDTDGRYLHVNRRFLLAFDKTAESVIGKTDADLFPPTEAAQFHDQDLKVIATGIPLTFEENANYVDGTHTCIVTKFPLRDAQGGIYAIGGVVTDITHRKQAEDRILLLNRFYSTLSAINAAIIRARDRESLFRAVCDIVVKNGGFGAAWIRILDPDTRLLPVAAFSGISEQYFSKTRVSADPTEPEGRGPASLAMRENRIVISNDLLNDPSYAPWINRPEGHRFQSLAALPLTSNGTAIGVLVLTATTPDFFDEELGRLLRGMAGDISYALTGLSLQHEYRNLLHALQQSDAQFRELADHIPQIFWITDAEQKSTIYVSPAYETVTGRSHHELSSDAKAWLQTIHDEDRERVRLARKTFAPLGTYDIEYRLQHVDGTVRWIHDRAFPVRDIHGKIYRIAGIADDITERKQAREHLAQLAHYDSLTGLPNRVLFLDRLRQAIAQARRSQWIVGVLFLDLDRFKLVNDTLGHSAGDLLLKQVSTRLTQALRPSDTVGRLSGDEFAMIVSELAESQHAGVVAQKLIDALKTPFDLNGNEVFMTASMGITLFPSDGDNIEKLLRDADAAMYSAKSLGRNNYQFYTAEMNQRATEKLQLEISLRHAIERKEFVLHYQPKIDIASGTIAGVEALLRWLSPERGLVAPDRFIPLLEETGMIVAVGNWVARAACMQIRDWRNAGVNAVPIAINLSARQLRQPGFGSMLEQAMAEFDVPANMIEIEITESSLMENPEQAIVALSELHALGIHLSADDFGTGYSSLGYLKRLPLHTLKIDRSFVNDITIDPDDTTIAKAIITLAHSLGLKVVAEGVETEQQLTFLRDNRCDEAQGYLFSRPLPADDCARMLATGHSLHKALARDESLEAPTLLLVDDDHDHLTLTTLLLQRDGHRVVGASSTREAFEKIAAQRVDIVISDHNMPGMSGVEFLRRIKLMYPHIMRIMLSAVGDFQTAAAAINEGEVHKYFVKGRDDELLRGEIRKIFWQKESPAIDTNRMMSQQ